jgi:hypothetical protein
MPDALEILVIARDKIADPKDWGQGARPYRGNFNSCCAAEAIDEWRRPSTGFLAFDPVELRERKRAVRALLYAAGLENSWAAVVNWNDHSSHREVIAAFNLAIATLSLGAPVRRVTPAVTTPLREGDK